MHLLGQALLDHAPGVEDDHAVGHVARAGQVVGDVEQRDALVVAQVLHHVEQADADRDVEHGDRLVGQDQRRPRGQRLGEAESLALAAGELVGVARDHLRRRGSGRPSRGGRPPRRRARTGARRGGASFSVRSRPWPTRSTGLIEPKGSWKTIGMRPRTARLDVAAPAAGPRRGCAPPSAGRGRRARARWSTCPSPTRPPGPRSRRCRPRS